MDASGTQERCLLLLRQAELLHSRGQRREAQIKFRTVHTLVSLSGWKSISASAQLELALVSARIEMQNTESMLLLIKATERCEKSDAGIDLTEANALLKDICSDIKRNLCFIRASL